MNAVSFACFFASTFVISLFLAVLGFALYIFREHRRFDHLPGPKRSNFWLGNAKDIAAYRKKGKTFYDYFLAQTIEHGNLFVVFVCHKAIVFVSEPSIIRELLLKHHLLLPKDPKVYRKLGFVCDQPIAGHGLVTNTNEASWKSRRRCLKHAFKHGNVSTKFVEVFNDCAQVFLERLRHKADGETKIFMLEEFTRVALLASDQVCLYVNKIRPEISFFAIAKNSDKTESRVLRNKQLSIVVVILNYHHRSNYSCIEKLNIWQCKYVFIQLSSSILSGTGFMKTLDLTK
jgi:hypothetical protein